MRRPSQSKLAFASVALAALVSGCAPESAVRVRSPEIVAAQTVPTQEIAELDTPSGITSFVLPDALEMPKVYAADLLPASMLSGPTFEVAPEVEMKGHIAAFQVKSDYGRLDADSVEIVEQRVVEIAALAELERLSGMEVFGKSAYNSVKGTGKAVYNVFRDPAATARAIPRGIRKKVSNTWAAIKLKTKELGDTAHSKIRGDDAPPEFNAFLPDPPLTPEKTWEDRASSQGTKFGLSYIGYNRARRELTRELGVDPYTSNPQIEDRLDAFAWSYLAGSAGTSLVVGALTGGASVVLSESRQINKLVYDLSPEDVKKRNADELQKIGIESDTARNFLRNSTFTPTLQTAVVDQITENWQADGWKDLLRYLRYVDSEIEARFIVNSLRLVATQPPENKVVSVFLVGVTPIFTLNDGTLLVPAPVDYVYYNDKFKAFLGEPQLRGKTVQIAIAGKLSSEAERAIAARGWTVMTDVSFKGVAQYAQ